MRPSEYIHTIYRDREECSRIEARKSRLTKIGIFTVVVGGIILAQAGIIAVGLARLIYCCVL